MIANSCNDKIENTTSRSALESVSQIYPSKSITSVETEDVP